MITTDELFNEDFKPEWLTRKERLVQESLDQAVTAATNYKYQLEAAESRRRIAGRCDRRGNYRNPEKAQHD